MKKISDVKTVSVKDSELCYVDALTSEDMRLSGLAWKETNKNYHRMDDAYDAKYSIGVQIRSRNTSGVQLTVKTNSSRIGVHAVLLKPDFMEHMTDTAVGGFDIYKGCGLEKRYWKTVLNYGRQLEIHQEFDTEGELTDYTFNFPLYSGVESVEIGFSADAEIGEPTPYAVEKPVLFYGSSITQGGVASRPGNCYTNMLSRLLNIEIISLGFSSNCRGEMLIGERIASLDLAAFVYDYDHNAPDAEFLERTHEPFFKYVRSIRPDLPIIMITRPDYEFEPERVDQRRAVVYKTYENAVNAGDKNVYFINGSKMFDGILRDSCTIDGNHPTDLGFSRMAATVQPVLKQALGLK